MFTDASNHEENLEKAEKSFGSKRHSLFSVAGSESQSGYQNNNNFNGSKQLSVRSLFKQPSQVNKAKSRKLLSPNGCNPDYL